MKIAVTYDNGQVFQHFGHTQQFKIYDTKNGEITGSTLVDTNGNGHGALAGFLRQLGVCTLICGGIGGGAKTALADAGIEIYAGATGKADAAVEALLKGTLAINDDVECQHHSHEEGHSCGEHHHSCENHGCGNN